MTLIARFLKLHYPGYRMGAYEEKVINAPDPDIVHMCSLVPTVISPVPEYMNIPGISSPLAR